MESNQSLLEHVLVPVAGVADARTTAAALAQFDTQDVTILYVVERSEGYIDPVSTKYLEEDGKAALQSFKEVFPDANEHLTSSDNLIEEIYDVADEVGATAIAYRSRGGSRFVRLLSGDHSLKLIDNPPIPVISLPDADGLSVE